MAMLVLLICSTMSRRAEALPAKLRAAYKKEYAFLEATKRQLEKRLTRLGASSEKKVELARSEINSLQSRLVALRARAEGLAETLREAKRHADVNEDAERVQNIIERAREKVSEVGLAIDPSRLTEPEARAAMLGKVFAASKKLIVRSGKVRLEKGGFFLPGGARVEGTLVRVGGIATYGLSEKGSGALAPAGEGRLKLWPEQAAKTAKALARGARPEMLRIFVYETLEKPVQPKKEKTLLQTVQAGGLIAWVIVGIGAIALLLILIRIYVLASAGSNTRRLVGKVEPLLRSGRVEQARTVCKRSRGATARVLEATLGNVGKQRKRLEDSVSEAVLAELPKIERFGSAITVFAAVAPLLGLLGTVTGMISTFDVITEHGTGDPKLLSGGISEALITTQLGLCVAIPTLLIGTLLRGRAQAIEGGMERAAIHVINLVLDTGDEKKSKGVPLKELTTQSSATEAASGPAAPPTAAERERKHEHERERESEREEQASPAPSNPSGDKQPARSSSLVEEAS
jgi:biopolymer transport protein ExbB